MPSDREDDWMDDFEAGTERTVFRLLLVYLETVVPDFDVATFRKLVTDVVVGAPRALPRNAVTEWMDWRAQAIIAEMLPPPEDATEAPPSHPPEPREP